MSRSFLSRLSTRKKQRGSVPIVMALLAMGMVMMAGSNQQLSALLGLRGHYQSDAMKAAHNANVSAMVVAQQVFNARLLYPITNWDGTWSWSVTPAATGMWSFDANPATEPYIGTSRITIAGCNPQRFINLRGDLIYGAKSIPNPAVCASQNRELTTQVVLSEVSNDGFYVPGGDNWINVTTISSVPLKAAAPPGVFPANDSANIQMPPPIPRCNLLLSPPEIVMGQPFTGTLTTSANTQKGFLPNMANVIDWNAPVINSPPNFLGAPQPTASQSYSPPSVGSYSLTGGVEGYGGASTRFQCASNAVKVWPAPTCTITVNPNTIQILKQNATVTMTTNSAVTPIASATLNGNPVGAGGTTISVSPGLLGTYTYTGVVNGVNGSTATCSATLKVIPQPPVCAFTSVNPNPVQVGKPTTLTMATNGYYGQIVQAWIDGTALPGPAPINGGSKVVVPPTYPAVTYGGAARRSDGATDNCSVTVSVLPPPGCRFKNPSYHEPVAVPPLGMNVEFGQTWNTTGVGTCTWLCEDQPCPSPGVMNQVITFTNPESPGYNPACNNPPAMCIMTYVLAACSTPAADYIIANIDDPACSPSFFFMRGEGEGCYAPETRIRMADGSWRRADRVRAGDLLYRRDRPPLKVGKVFAGPEKHPLYRIRAGDRSLLVTFDHPIATRAGVKQAAEIALRDEVWLTDRGYVPVIEAGPQPVKPGQWVWNFQTEETSTDDRAHLIEAEGIAAGDLNLQNSLKRRKELP